MFWLHKWNAYLNSNEVVPEGMGMVHWWVVRGIVLPGPHPNKFGWRLVGLWPMLPDMAVPCA